MQQNIYSTQNVCEIPFLIIYRLNPMKRARGEALSRGVGAHPLPYNKKNGFFIFVAIYNMSDLSLPSKTLSRLSLSNCQNFNYPPRLV